MQEAKATRERLYCRLRFYNVVPNRPIETILLTCVIPSYTFITQPSRPGIEFGVRYIDAFRFHFNAPLYCGTR